MTDLALPNEPQPALSSQPWRIICWAQFETWSALNPTRPPHIHTPESSSLTSKFLLREKAHPTRQGNNPFAIMLFLIDAIVHITNFGTHGSVMDGHLVTGV